MVASKLLSELKNADVVFLSVPKKAYHTRFAAISAALADAFKRVCVVALDRDACELSKELNAAGIAGKSVLAVGVNKAASAGKCAPGETSINCDGSIVDLTMALYRIVDTNNPRAVLMGPMSLLAMKNGKMDALKFISYVADDSRKAKRKFVVVCTKEDVSSGCLKDVSLFVDKVVEEK